MIWVSIWKWHEVERHVKREWEIGKNNVTTRSLSPFLQHLTRLTPNSPQSEVLQTVQQQLNMVQARFLLIRPVLILQSEQHIIEINATITILHCFRRLMFFTTLNPNLSLIPNRYLSRYRLTVLQNFNSICHVTFYFIYRNQNQDQQANVPHSVISLFYTEAEMLLCLVIRE